MKSHKSSSEIIVSFCDQNEYEIFQERFLEETPVATIVDSWNKNGGKLDQMWVILPLTNAEEWEELKIWGTDNGEIILNFDFDIDHLIRNDEKNRYKLSTNFQAQLENNQTHLEALFRVSNLAIDWAGPNGPYNEPPNLSYYFDDEIAWLNIRISIKIKELDKSLRIGDLFSNFNEVRALLDKIIAELQKIEVSDTNLNHAFLNENYFFMFSAHGAEAARAIVRAAWDKLENTNERISGIEMRRFLNDKMDEVAFLNKAGFLNHPEIWDTEPRDEIIKLVGMKAKEVGYIDKSFYINLWDWSMGGLLDTKSETSSNNIKVGFCDLDGYVFRGTFSQETLVKDIADILIKEKAQRAPEDWDLFFVQFEIPAGEHPIEINIYQKEGEIYIYYTLNIAEILQIQDWGLSRLFFDEQLEKWRKKTHEQYKFAEIEIPWLTETISDLQVKIRLSKTNLNKSFRLSDLQKNAYDISKILSLNPESRIELLKMKQHELSAEISVSFCNQNEVEIFQKKILEVAPVSTIIDYWIGDVRDLDEMSVLLPLPNAKEWEQLSIMGTNNDELLFDYAFNIDELITADQKKHHKLATSFLRQLKNNKKQLLTLFGVSNMAIDWGGPNSPNNKPPLLYFYFDDEMAWLSIMISIKTKELDKSLRIGDLLDKYNVVRELLDIIIKGLIEI